MALKRQVHCVIRDNSAYGNRRITHLGGYDSDGTRWYVMTEAAIDKLRSGDWKFFISVAGHETDVIAREQGGTWVLTTERDGYAGNNLGSLPDCAG